jgi:hypothetical protein
MKESKMMAEKQYDDELCHLYFFNKCYQGNKIYKDDNNQVV